MLLLLIGVVIGLFIGWNVPQPAQVKEIQDKVQKLLFGDKSGGAGPNAS